MILIMGTPPKMDGTPNFGKLLGSTGGSRDRTASLNLHMAGSNITNIVKNIVSVNVTTITIEL